MLCTNVLKCYENLVPLEWYVFVSEGNVIFLCSNFGEIYKFMGRDSFEKYIEKNNIKYMTRDKLPEYKNKVVTELKMEKYV